MITVTRLNGATFALNPDLIERVETTPDTIIILVDGAKYVVCESVDEIILSILESKAAVIAMSHTINHVTTSEKTVLRVVPIEPES